MPTNTSTNLSIRDVFVSHRRNSITEQGNLLRTSNSENGRFVTFGSSFGFGKGDTMRFSEQKRF